MSATRAGEAPDDGLLEFLGSVDSEDKDWHEYLARTDIDKIARRAGNQTGNPGGKAPARPPPVEPTQDAPPAQPAPPSTAGAVTPP